MRLRAVERYRSGGAQENERTVVRTQDPHLLRDIEVGRLQVDDGVGPPIVAGESMGRGAASEAPGSFAVKGCLDQALESLGVGLLRAIPPDQESRANECFVPLEPKIEKTPRLRQRSSATCRVNEPLFLK